MKAAELRSKSTKELHDILAEKTVELRKAKASLFSGELQNVRNIPNLRRSIARIKMVLHEVNNSNDTKEAN